MVLLKTVIYPFCFLLCLIACSKSAVKTPPPPIVEIEKVQKRSVPVYVLTIGHMQSPHVVVIRPQVSGMLLTIHFDEGEEVEAGQLLYSIDERPFQAALDQALAALEKDKANLLFAKQKVDRYAQVLDENYVSIIAFEEYQRDMAALDAQVAQDQAAVDRARVDLSYCKITAPIKGRLGAYLVEAGNVVTPQEALIELRQIDPIDVLFSVPQSVFESLKQAKNTLSLPLEVFLPQNQDIAHMGQLTFIDNQVDPLTGSMQMKGQVPNSQRDLWPGEYVRVKLLLNEIPDALVIPLTALQNSFQGFFVYTVQQDKVLKKPIEIGPQGDTWVVVNKGLAESDEVVVEGQLSLRSGITIRRSEKLGGEGIKEPLKTSNTAEHVGV